MIGIFMMKMIDNMLGTAKTIYIGKERYFLGSVLNTGATFFYLVAFSQMIKDNSMRSIFAMCIATFIGTYLPGVMIKRSERDKLYIFNITTDTLENGIKFADQARSLNLAVKTTKAYDDQTNKTLSCKIYCMTREESRMVISLLEQYDFKYNAYVPVEH